MSRDRAEHLNQTWDEIVSGGRASARDEDAALLSRLTSVGRTVAPRERIWMKAQFSGATNTSAVTMPQFNPRRSRSERWGSASRSWHQWLAAAALFVALVGGFLVLSRDVPERWLDAPSPTPGIRVAAPTALPSTSATTSMPVPTQPASATFVASPAAVDGNAQIPTEQDGIVVNSSDEGPVQCPGAFAQVPLAGAADGKAEVAFLRITLPPGTSIALPATAGPICIERGEAEANLGGGEYSWQPVSGMVFEFSWTDVRLRSAGGQSATLLVALTGENVRRIAVPDGVTLLDLGGGIMSSVISSEVLVKITAVHLEPGQMNEVDTGQGGAVIVSVESGSITESPQSGITNQPTRHDRRPMTFQEQIALQGDDAGNTTLPAGYSFLSEEAVVSLTAESDGADLLLLTIDPNSALLAGIDGEATMEAGTPAQTATPQSSPAPLPPCTSPELDRSEFEAFFGAPLASPTVEAILNRPRYTIGDGVPASAEIANDIRKTVEQAEACANEQDAYRWLGLFTPTFLGSYVYGEGETYDQLTDGMSFDVAPENPPTVVVWDVRIQADGRVTAKVESGGSATLYTFAEVNGRWRIDDFDDTAIIEPAPTVTP